MTTTPTPETTQPREPEAERITIGESGWYLDFFSNPDLAYLRRPDDFSPAYRLASQGRAFAAALASAGKPGVDAAAMIDFPIDLLPMFDRPTPTQAEAGDGAIVYSEEERDGMAAAFKHAQEKHGFYESLFAVASYILRKRRLASTSNVSVPDSNYRVQRIERRYEPGHFYVLQKCHDGVWSDLNEREYSDKVDADEALTEYLVAAPLPPSAAETEADR